MDYNNILGGLRVQTQIPLDVKTYSKNEETLSNLGIGNQLAYTYTQGLVIYTIEEQTRWEWREVNIGEENTGLLDLDFVYPNGINTFGIDYSLKKFNFFPYLIEGNIGPEGPRGEQGLPGPPGPIGLTGLTGNDGLDGISGLNGVDGLSSYDIAVINGFIGTESDWLITLQGPEGPQGPQGPNGEDASNNLQKTITSNYTLQDIDNNYTILVDNTLNDISIYVPDGLMENFCAGFIQQGRKNVTFSASGTGDIRTPTGYKIKGLNYNAYIEQIGTTNSFHLIGALII